MILADYFRDMGYFYKKIWYFRDMGIQGFLISRYFGDIYLYLSLYKCCTPSRTFLAGVCCLARLAEKKKIKAK